MHKIQDPIVGIRHDEGSVPNTFSCFPLSCKYRTCNNYLWAHTIFSLAAEWIGADWPNKVLRGGSCTSTSQNQLKALAMFLLTANHLFNVWVRLEIGRWKVVQNAKLYVIKCVSRDFHRSQSNIPIKMSFSVLTLMMPSKTELDPSKTSDSALLKMALLITKRTTNGYWPCSIAQFILAKETRLR